ncbi:MAG: prepilin-type N-terminal cleavage/methylation domain-containing protein [Candidatus Eremiobacteraeota bacterium]|nr:prepilin-type N-terminal cleavage/methylation domain-containing protein [Candidatus Eremiobacteraeota bacterium]
MRQRRGFTLLELMVCLGVFSLLLLCVYSLQPSQGQAGAGGAAMQLSDDLRSLRLAAISTGEPQAFVLPAAAASGFYVCRGEHQMQVIRSQDFGRDFGGATAFLGYYPTSASVTLDSPITFQVDDLILPDATHPALIFLPSGEVTSNGLPLFDDAYRLIVSSGATTSGGAAVAGTPPTTTPVALSTANQLAEPFTLTVTPSGEVNWAKGAYQASPGVAVEGRLDGALLPLPAMAGAATTAPQIVATSLQPDPNQTHLPPGLDATVSQGGYIELLVEAVSPEGAALFCNWTTTQGVLSSATPTRMEWDSAAGRYRSRWVWHAQNITGPATLQVQVTDEFGNVATSAAGVNTTYQTGLAVEPGKMVLWTQKDGEPALWIANPDGSELTPVVTQSDIPGCTSISKYVSFSGDGSWVVFTATVSGSTDLMAASLTGSNIRRLGGPVGSVAGGPGPFAVSRDGTRVAYWGGAVFTAAPRVITMDGTLLWTGPTSTMSGAMAFSPDGSRLAVNTGYSPSNLTIYEGTNYGSTLDIAIPAGEGVALMRWATANELAVTYRNASGYWLGKLDISTATAPVFTSYISLGGISSGNLALSSGGTHSAVSSGGRVILADLAANTTTVVSSGRVVGGAGIAPDVSRVYSLSWATNSGTPSEVFSADASGADQSIYLTDYWLCDVAQVP